MQSMEYNIIYMAAGNSTRFGSNKMYADIGGKKLYMHTLDMLLKYVERNDNTSLVVVTRYKEIMDYVAANATKNVVNTYSPDSEKGISYTIKMGIGASVYPKGSYIFVVADQPGLTLDTIDGLIRATAACNKGIGCVTDGMDTANPVMFKNKYKAELMQLTGDAGGKSIVKKHEADCFFYKTKPSELRDIDYPEDC